MKKKFTTLLALGALTLANAQTLQTGPSTTTTPYMWPLIPGGQVKSILSSGDVVGSYTMAGIADGMGIVDNGSSTFTLVMNHEMGNTSGSTHAHGQTGAFVSKWEINKSNLQVLSGSDLIQNVKLWTGTTYSVYNSANTSTLIAFTRFCSGDLPEVTAFYNPNTGKGTQDRILMNGEESGNEGRAFAHIVTGTEAGTSYQLPYLGRASWENSVASPFPSDKTIVVGLDDSTPGQVYVYVGNKAPGGNTIEKAGLHGGVLYGISVLGFINEQSGAIPAANTPFFLVNMGTGIQNQTGATLNTNSNNAGITNFLRPEDGAWDPNRRTDFYFATTNAITSPSRLWRLRFTDINNPELGGTITAVLDGTEGQKMMDNLTLDNHGHILLQEDPGGNNYRAKIYQYKISTDVLTTALDQDSTRFQTAGANFLTIDEESSGIIDAQGVLGAGWSLFVHQSHYSLPNPMVEGGQLMAYFNPASAAANPEINIQGNNISIPDESTVTTTGNNTDFGTNNVGVPVSKTFVIQNTNTGTLIVSYIEKGGANAGDFQISAPSTPFTIGPNSSQSITVVFTAPLTGTRSAELRITSSDWDEKIYNYALRGIGALPEINVQGNSNNIPSGNITTNTSDNTDFGTIQLGASVNKSFVIQNTGTGTLTIQGITLGGLNSNEFTVVNPPAFPLTLAGNSTQNINVQFLPLVTGTRTATMWIQNSDNDENNYSFVVIGKSDIDVGISSYETENLGLTIFPNPSNNEAVIKMELKENSKVSVSVYDITGAVVYTINEKEMQKGEHQINLNTSSFANGGYFVSVNSNSKKQTLKLVVSH